MHNLTCRYYYQLLELLLTVLTLLKTVIDNLITLFRKIGLQKAVKNEQMSKNMKKVQNGENFA